jgi:hypothetical protein
MLHSPAVTCADSENLQPWQRPLASERLGLRRDAFMSRVKGAYVDREYVHPADVTAVLAERHADRMQELEGRYMGVTPQRRGDRPYPLAQRVEDLRASRGDEAPWRWGSEPSFGGGGTAKVGPGWRARFDAGEIEVLIDGQRCIQDSNGAWLTADGAHCPLAQEH